jgi:hypothetical protein
VRRARGAAPLPVTVLIMILFTVVACGDIGRDPDAGLRAGPGAGSSVDAEAVRAAARATLAAGGADIAVAARGPARGRVVETTGTGTVDLVRGGAAVLLRVGALGPVRARMRDERAYAALPPQAVDGIARGRTWVSVAMPDVDRGLYADTVVQLGTGVTGNPADIPALLASLGDRDAVVVGPDDVDGTPTTRYRVSIDLARVAAQHPELAPVLDRYRADTNTAGLPTASVSAEVWVDGTGRLRRVVQLLGGAGAVSTVTLANPGPRPAVAAPQAEEVTDLFGSLED